MQAESQNKSESSLTISKKDFETTINGKSVSLYVLSNKNGMKIAVTNYGGRIVSWMAKDMNGEYGDIVLGFDSIEGYLNANEVFYGPIIGRFGNRIAKGLFTLDGKTYQLATNNGPNHLHGGPGGFHNVVWDAKQIDSQHLLLEYFSPDGEEGYPGDLNVQVMYSLNDANELSIDYTAVANERTVVNLTNHAFWNLGGEASGTINDHLMMVNADSYTPVDQTLIPTGEIASVSGTPFDFRTETAIGARVGDANDQLSYGKGYDHNFALNKDQEGILTFAVSVKDPESGRKLSIYTTEPGLQFYGGNFMNGSEIGKFGKAFEFREAFVLEPQHFPDAPNQPTFTSTILEPFEIFRSMSVYKISAE